MIELKNLTIKNFNQEENILEDINVVFEDLSFVAIIGCSGVGKTTLLNSLVKNCQIVNGNIIVDGKCITKMKKKELIKHRKSIGWITQKNILIEDLTVYDNLKLYYKNYINPLFRFFNIMTKRNKEEILTVLEKLNMGDKCYQKVKELSGGQQRRVEIAKLLLNKYKIIIADEPLSNLDVKNSTEALNLLKMVAKENCSIVLLTIHDIDQIINNLDRVVILKNKKIVFDGPINKVTRRELINYYG